MENHRIEQLLLRASDGRSHRRNHLPLLTVLPLPGGAAKLRPFLGSPAKITPQLRLRQALEQLKYQQRRPFYWLAAQAGISESRLSRILGGYAHARQEEKEGLVALVGQTVAEIFELEEETEGSHSISSAPRE